LEFNVPFQHKYGYIRDEQHAQKFDKDLTCGSGDILVERQTYRQTYSSLYFATAPAVK